VAGSSFCMSCGTAVPSTAAATGAVAPSIAPGPSPPGYPTASPPIASGPMPSAAPMSPPTNGPSLTALLGLEGKRQFIVQHQVLALGHSYRVMDHEKRHLFAVKGDVVQQMQSNMMGSLLSRATGSSYMAGVGERSTNMTYSLVDAQGAIIGTFTKQGGANDSVFTLTDLQGRPWVIVTLNRGGFGGITATAVYPDGRPMLQTHGNLLRHDFRIRDPSGAELAKVHEAWAAVRDTYHIDTEGNIDPLYPLVFAILIDYEKVK
jgi:uncharacterized protein YxjI